MAKKGSFGNFGLGNRNFSEKLPGEIEILDPDPRPPNFKQI